MQPQQNAPGRARSLDSLVELVAALDRHVPKVGPGAQENAQEASELRAEASLRITELRTAARSAQEEDLARSSSVMADDGGPAPKE
jgi:hypothetical protein